MNAYEKLKKEFEDKVIVLQSKCKHKKSTWCEEWWAIGHSTGNSVKVCDECNKKIEVKKAIIK